MATLVKNKSIPMEYVLSELVLILISINDTMEFDSNNNPTGKSIGYTLTCIELENFEKIRVKIPRIKLPITNEVLKEKAETQERVFIELEEAYVKPYYSSRTKTIEDSITALGFSIVDSKF